MQAVFYIREETGMLNNNSNDDYGDNNNNSNKCNVAIRKYRPIALVSEMLNM
jgi:hypothetical protein